MKRLLLFIALASVAHAAGSVQQNIQNIGGNVYAFSFNWTGDASNGTVPATVAQGSLQLQGYRVISIETTPGSPAPTNGYSITLIDNAGVDIMAGASASLSSSSAQSFAGSPTAPPLYGSFTFTVTGNSVASAKGSAVVYLAPLSQVLGLSPTSPTFPAQGANLVYASPNGASGSPGFRAVAIPGDFGANIQGNGTKVQLSTGATTSGDCVKFDANGNTIDNGTPCSSLPAGTQTQFLEVKPNTGNNTTLQFQNQQTFNASDYNFPAYSCNASLICVQGGTSAGSLAVGNNTLTFNGGAGATVPLGMNGNDTGHNVYISGGTGAAEQCLINGGTGTAGGTGTITINCANTHTGAWTFSPNWLGAQEAVQAACTAGTGGLIQLLAGTQTVRGTLTVPCSGIMINGAGQASTSLFQNIVNVNMITTTGSPQNSGLTVQYLTLNDAVSTTAGSLINLNNAYQAKIQFAAINQGFNGIHVTGGSIQATFTDMLINNQINFGILADGSINNQGFFLLNSNMGGQTAGCIDISAGGLGTRGVDLFNCGKGVLVNPSGSQQVVNTFFVDTYFDTNTGQGVLIQPVASGTVQSLFFTGCWSVNNGLGVYIDSTNGTINNIQWNGGIISNSKTGGFTVTGPASSNIMLQNAFVGANSQMTAGTFAGVNTGGTINNLLIQGNLLGSQSPNNGQFCDICLGGTQTNTIIENNLFRGIDSSTIALQGGPTLNSAVFSNNPGYNPVGNSTLTCSASPCTQPSPAKTSASTLYLAGGTVSSVTRGGLTVCTASPCAVALAPNQQAIITYTVVPTTITLDVQ